MTSASQSFQEIGSKFRSAEWEVRFESPQGAYLHVSKPLWADHNMNGIHLEAYVAGEPRGEGDPWEALVALHCEGGAPVKDRSRFMEVLAERVGSEVDRWEGGWKILPGGLGGCSVCEVRLFIRGGAEQIVDVITAELRRLQGLDAVIDATIAEYT